MSSQEENVVLEKQEKSVSFDETTEKTDVEPENEVKEQVKTNPLVVLFKNIRVLLDLSISRGSFKSEETTIVGSIYNDYIAKLSELESDNANVSFPIKLLTNVRLLIDAVVQRGKFLPQELMTVGQVYNSLIELLKQASSASNTSSNKGTQVESIKEEEEEDSDDKKTDDKETDEAMETDEKE